ncbi:MAG: quinol:cytochrome C oxidoreductase, partial [Bacteroidia bacterium]|nr:quinol:cytochrome C oxidoreductase [Bacteroidia bacterium]
MYTFSNRLKVFAIVLVILGAIGVVSGFMSSHKSLEDVKVMLAEEASHHGSDHADATHEVVVGDSHAEGSESHEVTESSHGHAESASASNEHSDDEHAEHVLHQVHNRPYAALYVAAFFFMMISLGVLAFYAVQY